MDKVVKPGWAMVLGMLVAMLAGCATQDQKVSEESRQEAKHEVMARMHDYMSVCLREGHDPQQCRSDLEENCPAYVDGQCPILHEMMGANVPDESRLPADQATVYRDRQGTVGREPIRLAPENSERPISE